MNYKKIRGITLAPVLKSLKSALTTLALKGNEPCSKRFTPALGVIHQNTYKNRSESISACPHRAIAPIITAISQNFSSLKL